MVAERGWDEGLDWQVPAPGFRTLRRAEVATLAVAAAVAVGAILALAVSGVAGLIAAAALLVAGAVVGWVVGRRVRSWRFAERGEDLIVRRGVMFRRTSIIPYGRMQYVEVSAGPLERLFGLATVQMHTAAAASDARVPGLAAADAARLRDQLTTLGESRAAGL